MKLYKTVFDIAIKVLFIVIVVLAEMYHRATNEKIHAITERVIIVEKELSSMQLQYLQLLVLECNEVNQRSRKPQELSLDQCREYGNNTLDTYSKMPTPTAHERDTTRRGLVAPSPTPCDPHVALCTRFN